MERHHAAGEDVDITGENSEDAGDDNDKTWYMKMQKMHDAGSLSSTVNRGDDLEAQKGAITCASGARR